jgi:uncharacterized membrane protein YccC
MTVWTSPESLTALLGTTLGRTVKATPVSKREPKNSDFVAVYAHDRRTRAAFFCDLALAAYASDALQVFPQDRATENIANGDLEEDLRENLHEIFNICTQVINAVSPVHVSLAHVCQYHEAPQWLQECLGTAETRMNVEVEIHGYGRGRIGLALFGGDW